MMYQSIKVSYPKSHGNAPKVASRPSAPNVSSRQSVPKVASRQSAPKKRVVVATRKNNTSYAKR